jgi:parallel beta-helix repeat protein
MSQHPAAFMSYVRFDDQHENGRLSEFCNRLSGEVRLQTGEKFHIFQDRNDISWGQQWQQRLDESLDVVTFLIPIVTPSFFKSPPCRGELERFLEREKRIKRNDLILPVYYVNCAFLNDPAKQEADSLTKVIAAHQYADWRELRFEPFTSPQVGKMLAKMAAQIIETLQRFEPEPKTASAFGEGPRESLETVPAESMEAAHGMDMERMESAKLLRHPAQKTERSTLVVDALHQGTHPTLTDALKAAKSGDTILVRPGLYKEGVIIDKAVEIIGDGNLGEVVIEATGKDVVLFQASMGRITNLTLRQAGGGKFYGVDIAQGRLDLEGCDITSQSLACIAIHEGADPRLRRNRIHDGADDGVFVSDNGLGTLEDNDIFSNAKAGVAISKGGNPTVRRSRIHDGNYYGVFVYDNGLGLLEDNDIFHNAYAGLAISKGGNPTARSNRIRDGRQSGVFVSDNGRGTLEDNDIFGNAKAGVIISKDGNPTVRGNRIRDWRQSGVFVSDNGRGTLEDNDIFGNTHTGVAITEGGNPCVRGNRISKNAYQAIRISHGGFGVFEANDLRGNAKGPWDISLERLDKIKRERNQV